MALTNKLKNLHKHELLASQYMTDQRPHVFPAASGGVLLVKSETVAPNQRPPPGL